MTRLYGDYEARRCSLCQKIPSTGWLYRCTQDTNGFLPESEFYCVVSPVTSNLDYELQSYHSLRNTVLKAEEEVYTEEQLNILKAQKENVKKVILQEQQPYRPETSSSSSANSSTFSALHASTTNSSLHSLNSKLRAAYDWSEAGTSTNHWPANAYNRVFPTQQVLDAAPCDFRVCGKCRPSYKERAYASLGAVVNEPTQLPPEWELNNRRVSDARVVSKIGVPKMRDLRWIESANVSIESLSQGEGSPGKEMQEDRQVTGYSTNQSPRRRSGIREAVRRTLHLGTEDQKLQKSNNEDNTEQSASPGFLRSISQSMLFIRRRSHPSQLDKQGQGTVVESKPLQDSLMLMLAKNTPLPTAEPTPTHTTSHSQHSLHMPLGSSPRGASMADLIAWA